MKILIKFILCFLFLFLDVITCVAFFLSIQSFYCQKSIFEIIKIIGVIIVQFFIVKFQITFFSYILKKNKQFKKSIILEF